MSQYADQAVQEAVKAITAIESIPHLKDLQTALADHIKACQSQQRAAAVMEMEKIAAGVGMKLKDLVAIVPAKEVTKAPVKYRHPDDVALEWTGRGRQPKWVVDWLGTGRTLAGIEVKAISE